MPLPLILEKHKGFYSIPAFEALGARALFTTRAWDMSFKDSRRGPRKTSRTAAYQALEIRKRDIVCPSQVHNDTVAVVTGADRGRGAFHRATALQETDALITDKKRVALAVLTADCLPVFLFDPHRRVAALVHAGWRGTHKKIVAKAVRKMMSHFSTEPADLLAALGPCLRDCCYEVGKEFLGYFAPHVHLKGRKFHFDLGGAVAAQLLESGVAADRIHDSRLCTSCMNHEFFSYRREGAEAGRSMSLVEIKDDASR